MTQGQKRAGMFGRIAKLKTQEVDDLLAYVEQIEPARDNLLDAAIEVCEGMGWSDTSLGIEWLEKFRLAINENHRLRLMSIGRIVLRYDWRLAAEAGFDRFPQRYFKKLGIVCKKSQDFGIVLCSMVEVETLPEPMPDFLTFARPSFKFTDEQ